MIHEFKFKAAARVPAGVTANQVMAEKADIEAAHGRVSPDIATAAVLADEARYPALRAFGPKDRDEAYYNAVRDGITYALRAIIPAEAGEGKPEVRVNFLVREPEHPQEEVYREIEYIARRPDLFRQLQDRLEADLESYIQRHRNTLAELRALLEEFLTTATEGDELDEDEVDETEEE